MKPKVLIVDHDEIVLEFLNDILSQKLDIETATSPEEAFKLSDQNDFDLLISELNFDEISGETFIRRIKKQNPQLFILVITQKSSIDSALNALRLGAIDYLIKPFPIEQLAQVIDKFFALIHSKEIEIDFKELNLTESRSYTLKTDFDIVNPFMSHLMDTIKKYIESDRKVLLALRLSIYEMLINSFEHGNLSISYKEKQKLIEQQPNYHQYLKDRSNEEKYKDRKVTVSYHYTGKELKVSFKDDGNGFDVNGIPDPKKKENLNALNGRGIFITKVNMDKVTYNQKGNKVTITKKL